MSQEKAQLIAPLGNMTVPGVTATGVITATSFEGNIAGSATSIKQGTSISAGVVTASSFAGNLTGNIQRLADSGPNISVGVVTATSFSGNLTGSVTDLTSQPAISVGVVTATSFSGPVTGDIRGNITGNVSGVATGSVTGDVSGLAQAGLGINYNGGWPGAGTSQISAGVVTATSFYGDGSNLDGVSSGPVSQQAVTIDGASTSIDLSNGNVIYATQSANTTVSFANSENGNVYFIRTKDDNTTARTITWPDRINWEGGSAPTLVNNPRATDAQIFLLVTRNMGVTWYGKEVVRSDPQTFALWTWGSNNYGELGLNSRTQYSSPVQLGTDANWSSFFWNGLGNQSTQGSVGGGFKVDGTMWMWGQNNYGNLGDNSYGVYKSSPVQLPGTDWSAGSMSYNGSIATKTDGTLWAWGYDSNGSMGTNTNNAHRSSPVQIPGTTWGSSFQQVCKTTGAPASTSGSAAIKTDGTLWSWGDNYKGQLGLNNQTDLSSPTQVGTDTDWTAVAGVRGRRWALQGTELYTWGYNSQGSLGHNNDTDYSSPRQVPGAWANIHSGAYNFMATKSDGTLWACGLNDYGQLGQNEAGYPAPLSSPTQIPGTTWNQVACGYSKVVASKTDGTLWVWGYNDDGGLGMNLHDNAYSSPTQLPGTDWTGKLFSGGDMQRALRLP